MLPKLLRSGVEHEMLTAKGAKYLVKEAAKLLWIVFLIFSIPAAVVWLPLLLIAIISAKFFRPSLGPIAQGTCLAFMTGPPQKDSTNLLHILVLDNVMSVTEFRTLFHDRVIQKKGPTGELAFPHFRNTWEDFLFHTFWKPESNYSTGRHIRDYDLKGEFELPSPCRMEDIQKILGTLVGKPWPDDFSPWEILLIKNFKTAEDDLRSTTALIFRHSHGLIDGYGLVSVIKELSGSKYDLPLPNFPKVPIHARIFSAMKVPYYLGPDCLDAAHDTNWIARKSGSPHLIASMTELISVESIKEIKNKLAVNYATVLFTAAGGALERIFAEEKLTVPDAIDAWTASPLPNHPGGTVNHAISLRFTLKIKCESSLKRLQAIEQNLQASRKGIISAYQSSDFKNYLMLLIPTLLRQYAINSTIRNGSMVSSIFPVTNQVVKLDGKQILELTSTIGAFGNSAISLVITGLTGKHRVVAMVDANKVRATRSLPKFGRYFEEEIAELLHQ